MARAADPPGSPWVTMVPLIHPDWSGVWKAAPGTVDEKYTPFESASRMAHGGGVPSEEPPLKPEFRAVYRERLAAMRAGTPVVDPSETECLPCGMPRMRLTQHHFRLSVTPKYSVWYTPWGSQPRDIYLDGRVHPSDDDIDLYRPWVTTLRYVRVKSGDIGDEYSCSAERSHGQYP